ncbi:MAG: YcgL domain-containing protein [Immundisolibacteraceae bacterium]|nr:YcgL domain-containing protein [Immundisolibacteraceae bacterium]
MNIDCSIFKTNKKEGAYLYLAKSLTFEELPEPLQELFSERIEVMELAVTPDTHLATEDVAQVLSNLGEQGFHLQLQPVEVAGTVLGRNQ